MLPTARLRAFRNYLWVALLAAAFVLYLIASYSVRAREDRGQTNITAPAQAQTVTGQETTCCGAAGENRLHLLVGSYYTFKDGKASTMLLNNKGPQPLEVRPVLYSLNGERFDVTPLTVEGSSFRMVDMSEWIAGAGAHFREGSVQIFHYGRDLVLGAQVFITDEAHSLSFEEKLVEPVTFKSSRLESLWWLPNPRGKVILAVSNIMDVQTSATITIHGERPIRDNQTTILLAPHETHLFDVQRDLSGHEHGAMSQFGGISITYSGINGGVNARGYAQNSDVGYSLALQFSEPAAAKSVKLQGAGLRVGQAGGSRLTPLFIARNVGDVVTTITGRLPYTDDSGNAANIALPDLSLAPGEMSVIDASQAVRAAGLTKDTDYTGVEFEYTGAPGNVTITALSVGQDGNQVFRVPLWDISAQRSSTGGYPWSDGGHSTTTIYIKNTADHPQRYYLELKYPGGVYSIGVKTIEGGKTASYDLRKLRDEQVPGLHGELIPLDVRAGQIHWSKVGTEEGVLIGRVEQADTVLGVSSNYACVNCCNDNPTDISMTPSSDDGYVDDSETFVATYRLGTCYGYESEPIEVDDAVWKSSDTGIATVSAGVVTGVSPGTVTITATWWADKYTYTNGGIEFGNYGELGGGYCQQGSAEISATASYSAKPTITSISPSRGVVAGTTHVTLTGRGFNSGTIINAGSDISVSNKTVDSSTSISADFSVAINASGGNRSISVTVNGQTSGSVNFFVQIPTSLSLAIGNKNTYNGDPLRDCEGRVRASSVYGYGYLITYTVIDQTGTQAIESSGLTAVEQIYKVSSNPTDMPFEPSSSTGTTPLGTFCDIQSFTTNSTPAPQSGEFEKLKQIISIVQTGRSDTVRVNCINKQYNDLTITDTTANPDASCQ